MYCGKSWCPKAHWNRKRFLKKPIKKDEKFVENEDNNTEVLCNINTPIWQWMPGDHFADEEDTWSNRDFALQKNAGNTMDSVCKKERIFKMSAKHNDGRRLGEIHTHKKILNAGGIKESSE